MADFDINKLKEWQQDILIKASILQRNAIIRYLEKGWEIIEGKFGGDTLIGKGSECIKIDQFGSSSEL